MDIGVCLPTTVPGADGGRLIEFARRAEQFGFAALGVNDRLVYDNYDSVVALAAAAGVTERIELTTSILLAAYRPSVVELAKQLASLDRLSGGRLVLGVASGMREDDYTATGTEYHHRGSRLDSMLDELAQVWQGDGPVPGVGPRPTNGSIPLWIGGMPDPGLRRAAKYGIGYISPGGPPAVFPDLVAKARASWAEQGRADMPKIGAMCYSSLGKDGAELGRKHALSYYSYLGPMAERLAASVISDESRLREAIDSYAANGVDRLMIMSCSDDPGRLDLLAKVALG
jgi:alkanesulfonate monooxygenase SsuD/methylene tetrahydromethanopterin reductase-like flavin-dependent oxidoreductase (luciferase family)